MQDFPVVENDLLNIVFITLNPLAPGLQQDGFFGYDWVEIKQSKRCQNQVK